MLLELSRLLCVACFGLLVLTSANAQSRTLNQEKSADAFSEMDALYTLRFLDAVNGKAIAGANVRCEEGSGTTDSEGAVRFPLPLDLGPDVARSCSFRARGYVSSDVQVKFLLGVLFHNRFPISPSLGDDKLRIVLDWAKKPKDLDAHLAKFGSYHISYRHNRTYEDAARLDRDDMDGFGPETITLSRLDLQGNYRFLVHDYAARTKENAKSLSGSRARVMVFSGNGLVNTFHIPEGVRGNQWTVFEIQGGEVVTIDRVETSP